MQGRTRYVPASLRVIFLEIIHQDSHHPVVSDFMRVVRLATLQIERSVRRRCALELDTEGPVFQIVADHWGDAVGVIQVIEAENIG